MRFWQLVGIIIVALLFFGLSGKLFVSHVGLEAYAQQQWGKKSSVHKMGPVGKKPEFVVLFVHGFLGFGAFNEYDSWNEFVHKMSPVLDGKSYVVYHPGLRQTKDVQSFAQDYDVHQVRFHLNKVVAEVKKNPDESSLGGYSVSGLPIVGIGHSNGASTFLALTSRSHDDAKKLAGLMLLSPYADLTEASVFAKLKRWTSSWLVGKSTQLFFAPQYSPSKRSPLEYVEHGLFPDFLPTLFVNNRNDHVVPFKNRQLFSEAFQKNSKYAKTVTFIDLTTGGHNWAWKRVKLACAHCGEGCDKAKHTDVQKNAHKLRKYKYYLRSDDRDILKNAVDTFFASI